MKKTLLLIILFIAASFQTLWAQGELPEKYGIIVGGGVAFPLVDGNKNDYFNRNNNRAGYNLSAETRFYFSSIFAVGAQYEYINSQKSKDKMHVNFIAPELVLRYNTRNAKQGIFFSFAPGYLDYQERVYENGQKRGHRFQKGYFGVDFTLGYEFSIAAFTNGIVKINMLTADWGFNPDARLYNPNPNYEDNINHSFFKHNITFFNLGFALQFGK